MVWMILALLLSICLRFWGFPENIQWQDTGMELLRAFHVATYSEYPLLGVPANSIDFFHPPWYLYALGGIVKIIPDITTLLGLSVAVHAFAVIPLYVIVRGFLGHKIGIITAFLYAFNPTMVEMSHSLQSQNIIVPIFLNALAVWTIARVKPSLWVSILAVLALVFASTVNYASIPLLSVIFVWDIYEKRHSLSAMAMRITLWLGISVLLYLPLFEYFGTQTIIRIAQAPLIALTNPYTRQLYHFYLFIPVLLVGVSWTIVQISKNKIKQAILVLCTIIVMHWISNIFFHPTMGDYNNTLACTANLARVMQNIDSQFVLRDHERRDKREHILILIEQTLNRQLVKLHPQRDYFRWINEANITHLLCLKDKNASDIFLDKTCYEQFAEDAPEYQFVKEIPVEYSLPCRIYEFGQTNS